MTFIEKIKWLFSKQSELPKKESGAGNRTYSINERSNDELNDDQITELLLRHPIFTELREWYEYRVKVLAINDSVKRNMAKYYLELLFDNLKDVMKKIVYEHDKYLDDSIAFNNLIIDTINQVRQISVQHGVPEIFLNKFTNYLYTQTKILDSTYRDLDKFEFYRTKIARATVRLDLEFLTIRNITSEVEMVINDMNGELRLALEGSLFDN